MAETPKHFHTHTPKEKERVTKKKPEADPTTGAAASASLLSAGEAEVPRVALERIARQMQEASDEYNAAVAVAEQARIAAEERHRDKLTALVAQRREAEHRAELQVNEAVAGRLRAAAAGVEDEAAEIGAAELARARADIPDRVAPTLATAQEVKQLLGAWAKTYKSTLEELAEVSRETWLAGQPTVYLDGVESVSITNTLQQTIRAALDLYNNAMRNIETNSREVEGLIGVRRGTMSPQVWKSALVQALHELQMASTDTVATLHSMTETVTRFVEAIRQRKAEAAGTPEASTPISFENRGNLMADAKESARITREGTHPDHADVNYSVFRS